jgi:hypothetical protein
MNIYKDAMYSQGACNLGAIIHGWQRAIVQLQKEAHENGKGTEWVNTHPVNVLFAEQVFHLAGNRDPLVYMRAYNECAEKSEAEKVSPT